LGKEDAERLPGVAAGSTTKPDRDHIRLLGVGYQQYRKLNAFVQGGVHQSSVEGCLLKQPGDHPEPA
jgi:hypothetical protein